MTMTGREISQGLIYGIKVNDEIYVPANFKSPMEE